MAFEMTIHRAATTWSAGDVPESLFNLIKTHRLDAESWTVLPRAGNQGYKAVGLDLAVVDAINHGEEELAAAVMAMVMEHYDSQAAPFYKVECHKDGKPIDNVILRMAPDGAEDLNATTGGAWAFKELAAVHKRYLELLDNIAGIAGIAGQALDAMAGVVADAARTKMETAEGVAAREAAGYKHERQMKVMELLVQAAQANKAANPLREVLESAPREVLDATKEVVGDEIFAMLVKAAGTDDKDARKAIIAAALGKLTPAQKTELGKRVPEEWQAKLMAALQAELG